MKLEVGMYARTQIGTIGKIIKITNENIFFDRQVYRNSWYSNSNTKFLRKEVVNKYIKKASHNIIDLIEVGDYVNGDYVWEDTDGFHFKKGTMWVGDLEQGDYLNKTKIETIVTREQFEAMQYKVVEE